MVATRSETVGAGRGTRSGGKLGVGRPLQLPIGMPTLWPAGQYAAAAKRHVFGVAVKRTEFAVTTVLEVDASFQHEGRRHPA